MFEYVATEIKKKILSCEVPIQPTKKFTFVKKEDMREDGKAVKNCC